MSSGKQPDKQNAADNTGQLPSADVPFFAALRDIQVREGALIGRDARPSQEPVRLRAEPSLGYPPTELAKAFTDETGRLNLDVSFLGLFGPSGALPNVYTQMIIDRSRIKDHAMREFLNVFNHRWLSLFYRAWEKHDYAAAFQTAASLGQEDVVTQILWCLIGFGTVGQRDRLCLHDHALLHYSGLLSDATPRQVTLQQIGRSWFGIDVRILQFQGHWLSIPDQELSCMKTVGFGEASNNRLGVNAIAGSRVWNVESRFRVRIGPLSVEQFQQFSPSGKRLHELTALVRTYVGPQYDFDVQIVVHRQDVPRTYVGGPDGGSRLGWNTWLGNWPFSRDADDPVFELDDRLTLRASALTD